MLDAGRSLPRVVTGPAARSKAPTSVHIFDRPPRAGYSARDAGLTEETVPLVVPGNVAIVPVAFPNLPSNLPHWSGRTRTKSDVPARRRRHRSIDDQKTGLSNPAHIRKITQPKPNTP